MSGTPGSSQVSSVRTERDDGYGKLVAKPDLYHGERSKLEDWLMQVDLFFEFDGAKIPPQKRVALVTTYMRGRALQWMKPHLHKYKNPTIDGDGDIVRDDDLDEMMHDLEQFKKVIRRNFGNNNEANDAVRNIQHHRQERSVAEYATIFQQYAILTEWDDNALMVMFKKGLKKEVKEELMRTGATLDNLEDLIQESIDIGEKLYELKQELRDDGRYKSSRSYSSRGYVGVVPESQHQRRPNANRKAYRDPDAMEIDNIIKGKPGRPKTGQETRNCYNCGKPGHLAKNCRSKKRGQTRQLNVLSNPREVDEEWMIVTSTLEERLDLCDQETGSPTELATDDEEYHTSGSGPPARCGQSQPGRLTPYPWQEFEAELEVAGIIKELGQAEEGSEHRARAIYEELRNGEWITLEEDEKQNILDEFERHFPFTHENGKYVPLDDGSAELITEEEHARQGHATATELIPHMKQRYVIPYVCQTVYDVINNCNFCNNSKLQQYSEDGRIIVRHEHTSDLIRDVHESEGHVSRHWTASTMEHQYSVQGLRAQIRRVLRACDICRRHSQLTEEDNNWVSQELQEAERRMPIATHEEPQRLRYDLDYRNENHNQLSWIVCTYDECSVHSADKENGGFFPAGRGRVACKYKWFDCHHTECERHLWDKRDAQYFPGQDDTGAELQRMLLINGQRIERQWQTCIQPECTKCAEAKRNNGFGKQTFLGLRPAPGVDPASATQLTQKVSLDSVSN